MLNRADIIGRLGKDPEVRYSQAGKVHTTFTVATTRKFNKGDEKCEETEWHRMISFGRTAEVCGEYLRKGSLVLITGRLQTRSWDDKDGVKRYTTEIVVDRMQMLGSRDGGGRQDQPGPPDPFDKSAPDNIDDSQVPF